jgi:hypothetical protein
VQNNHLILVPKDEKDMMNGKEEHMKKINIHVL